MKKILYYINRNWVLWAIVLGLLLFVGLPIAHNVSNGSSLIEQLILPVGIAVVVYGGLFLMGLKD